MARHCGALGERALPAGAAASSPNQHRRLDTYFPFYIRPLRTRRSLCEKGVSHRGGVAFVKTVDNSSAPNERNTPVDIEPMRHAKQIIPIDFRVPRSGFLRVPWLDLGCIDPCNTVHSNAKKDEKSKTRVSASRTPATCHLSREILNRTANPAAVAERVLELVLDAATCRLALKLGECRQRTEHHLPRGG